MNSYALSHVLGWLMKAHSSLVTKVWSEDIVKNSPSLSPSKEICEELIVIFINSVIIIIIVIIIIMIIVVMIIIISLWVHRISNFSAVIKAIITAFTVI